MLQRLDQMEILQYNKPGQGPQLFFHHYRVDSRHLIINMERIGILRKRHESRTETMIAFLENKTECRERILLTWFGEKPVKDCGHCDVCRTRQAAKIDARDLRVQLLQMIKGANKIAVKELVAPYPVHARNEVLRLVRQMIDDGAIVLHGDFLSVL